MVLVDSSAWIESFRRAGSKDVTARVADLVARGEAAIAGIIKLELLAGARDDELEKLHQNLALMPLVSTREDHYDRAGLLGADLRRRGVSVPGSDLLIAVLAEDNGIPLLHCDRHFTQIAAYSELQAESP